MPTPPTVARDVFAPATPPVPDVASPLRARRGGWGLPSTTGRAAAAGLLVAVASVLSVTAYLIVAAPEPNPAGLITIAAMAGAAGTVAAALTLAVRAAGRISWTWIWASLTLVGVFLLMPHGLGGYGILLTAGVAVTVSSLIGGAIPLLGRSEPRVRRTGGLMLLLGGALLAAIVTWLLWEGPGDVAARDEAGGRRPTAPLADPATRGPHRVLTLTYGSGTDRHRPEFGSRVGLRTSSVDASRVMSGWDGVPGWARTRYWGFDATRLPLQGRVFYPDAPGPRPLVLIVHGNHLAEHYSDDGYAYLAELLASRGSIVVSVDQNFLNFSFADLVRLPEIGLRDEDRARAWLLLQHLRLWREWNARDGHPFAGRVDLDRVALIGHSLGGDAVAAATVLNRLAALPGDRRVALDGGFGIRSVVAFAPVAGSYNPGGTPPVLENVNYLVLHGSHDVPVPYYGGARQYERVRFTGGDWFKAGVYVRGANHGQFNSRWGRWDGIGPGNFFLNVRALMPSADQQRIAQVYVSAFLEATLAGLTRYRAVFQDPALAAPWLPATTYVTQYQDSTTRLVIASERDVDPTTITVPGGRAVGEGFSEWREGPVRMKSGWLPTRAVFLGWGPSAGAAPRYEVEWPAGALPLAADGSFTFRLADAVVGADEAVDLTVEVEDAAGRAARLPLSHVRRLPRQVPARLLKSSVLSRAPRSEPVFQTFDFPLADFAAANPALDPARLRRVRFVFDRTPRGRVMLDDVGFRLARIAATRG